MKRSPLKRRTPLRTRAKRPDKSEERYLWKQPVSGFCQCGCGRFSLRLQRHHVIYEQHVRKEHGRLWDMSNSMLLSPWCHEHHHNGWRRLPLENVPEPAVTFAIDLFGEDAAVLYFARYYASDISWRHAA